MGTMTVRDPHSLLYDFLADPRNINSRDAAIHNRLRQERIRRRSYLYLARGNSKWRATQRLMEELFMDPSNYYTIRRNDIPKKEITVEQMKGE